MSGGIFLPTFGNGYSLKLDKSVAKGKAVTSGQRLGKLESSIEGLPSITLYSTEAGWISAIHYQSDTALDPSIDCNARLLDLTLENPCQHDVVINNLCCACGEIVKSHKNLTTTVGGIQISKSYAETISQPKIKELYKSRKLMLILDLDHTLVHAEQFAPAEDFLLDNLIHSFTEEVRILQDQLKERNIATLAPGCLDASRQIIIDGRNLKEEFKVEDSASIASKGEYCQYVEDAEMDPRTAAQIRILESAIFRMEIQCDGWTAPQSSHFKLRPGVFRFLREMSKLFELYIYTAGVQQHASTALRLLDPARKYFPSNHVFSRDAVSKDGVKSLSRVLPSDHHAMIVIDDTPAAWDNDVGLFVCYPYVWFAPPIDHFVLPKYAFSLDIKVSAFRRSLWQYAPSRITQAIKSLFAILEEVRPGDVRESESGAKEAPPPDLFEEGKENNRLAQVWRNQAIEGRFGETMPRELRDSDLQLFSLCGILRTCHYIYFAAIEQQLGDTELTTVRIPSLKLILDEIKSRVLSHTRLYYGEPPHGWHNTQSCATFECLGCEVIHNDEIRTPTHILLSRNDTPPPALDVACVTMDWLEYAASTLTRPPDEAFDPRNSRSLRVFWDACNFDAGSTGGTSKRKRLGSSISVRDDEGPQEWLDNRLVYSLEEIIESVLNKSDTSRPRSAIPELKTSALNDDDLELALLEELGQNS